MVLVEKTGALGGNSAKASSGMNAVTASQGDSEEAFFDDTMASGGGLSDLALVATLAAQSEAALGRLEALGLDLSVVTQLGGHSRPRTHSNPQAREGRMTRPRPSRRRRDVDPRPRCRVPTSGGTS